MDTTAIARVDRPTGTAHIVVDASGANSIIVIPGTNGTLDTLQDHHRAVIERSDVLLLQLELPLSVVAEAAAFAHDRGARVVLTPAPVRPLDDAVMATIDLHVPNEGEALALSRAATAEEAAALLSADATSVVVTLGKKGALYLGPEGQIATKALEVTAIDSLAPPTGPCQDEPRPGHAVIMNADQAHPARPPMPATTAATAGRRRRRAHPA